jgi:hypothetical protein
MPHDRTKEDDMLSVNSYPRAYVDGCRAKIEGQIETYRDVVAAAAKVGAKDGATLDAVLAAFEPRFCNHMVMVVDDYFLHRSRNLELKDGNPLNEVRVICNSLRDNHDTMAADKQIKMDPDASILKLQVGDEISLSIDDLQRLAEAFFSEIERKYP